MTKRLSKCERVKIKTWEKKAKKLKIVSMDNLKEQFAKLAKFILFE